MFVLRSPVRISGGREVQVGWSCCALSLDQYGRHTGVHGFHKIPVRNSIWCVLRESSPSEVIVVALATQALFNIHILGACDNPMRNKRLGV